MVLTQYLHEVAVRYQLGPQSSAICSKRIYLQKTSLLKVLCMFLPSPPLPPTPTSSYLPPALGSRLSLPYCLCLWVIHTSSLVDHFSPTHPPMSSLWDSLCFMWRNLLFKVAHLKLASQCCLLAVGHIHFSIGFSTGRLRIFMDGNWLPQRK